MCSLLEGLLRSALDPDVDANNMMDVRLVVRGVGAVLRKHSSLAPDKCAVFLQMLLRGMGPTCMPWQRITVLQTIRTMVSDPMLVYRWAWEERSALAPASLG